LGQTVDEIKARLAHANREEFAVLERTFEADTRKGVIKALNSTRHRIRQIENEEKRIASLYHYQNEIAKDRIAIGLDEVGRGALAGPLCVGAVVLANTPYIEGLNDSKKLTSSEREKAAFAIRKTALAWTVEYIEAKDIDRLGMSASLRLAFAAAVKSLEEKGISAEVLLLDGNPLHIDKREVNIVKGDSLCASIAAASIIAKVERDALMCRYAQEYPLYALDRCKGYGSSKHIEAIKNHGLTPLHRKTFCTSFLQETLF
jgi:ribonuclease HII